MVHKLLMFYWNYGFPYYNKHYSRRVTDKPKCGIVMTRASQNGYSIQEK